LIPVEVIQTDAHVLGEVAKTANDGGELGVLRKLSLRLLKFLACSGKAYADALATHNEVIEFESSGLIRIAQASQHLLLARDHPLGLVCLCPHLPDGSVLGSAPRPFLHHVMRVLERAAHGVPDVAVELIDTDLRVVAHPSAFETMRVATNAPVVRVPPGLALGGLSPPA
jgi:hypothetical protein